MMLRPTINDLSKGKINRYELTLATAKCARAINNEYIKQKEAAEKAALAGKDGASSITVDTVLADTKAVRVAIDRIYAGQYYIVKTNEEKENIDAETTSEAEE